MIGEICDWCGEEFEVDVWEVWPETREFMLRTCCEAVHEGVVDELQGGSRAPWLRDLFAAYDIDIRQVFVRDGQLLLDWGLRIEEIGLTEAKAFVREHHRHNPPPVSWRWGHALYNGADLVGVAMVGRPVARMIDATTTVEVNRLCIDPGLDPALVWNGCSMLYGAARREAKRRGFQRVITYTLEAEAGTSLKAAGWTPTATTKGGTWNRKGRPRQDKAPTGRKIRWEAAA